MSGIFKVQGSVKEAGWGQEFWFGANENRPAVVRTNGHTVSLDEHIAQDPRRILGGSYQRLPFLLKELLVKTQPLSWQHHPPAWATESEPAKSEMYCALEKSEMCYGFRNSGEILALFESLDLSFHARFLQGSNLHELLAYIFLESDHPKNVQAVELIRQNSVNLPAAEQYWVNEIGKRYPDVSVFVPLISRLIVLQPGQAIAVKPGVVHALLRGRGIEAMVDVDVTIRAAMTDKEKDCLQFIRGISYEPCSGVAKGRWISWSEMVYPTCSNYFQLSQITLSRQCDYRVEHPFAQIFYASSPGCEVQVRDKNHSTAVSLGHREALFVEANTNVRFFGKGILHRVTVPSVKDA